MQSRRIKKNFLGEAEDLRNEMLHLKQENMKLLNERDIMKVKLRRTEEQFKRKTKTLEAMIIPHKLKMNNVSKEIMQTNMISNLTQENEHLKEIISEKENEIRRLYRIINNLKAYIPMKSHSSYQTSNIYNSRENRVRIYNNNNQSAPVQRTQSAKNHLVFQQQVEATKDRNRRSVSEDRNIPNFINLDIKERDDKQSEMFSPISDMDNLELTQQSPRKEIERLESCFKEILTEVKSIKHSISNIKKDESNSPDNTFEILSNEIAQSPSAFYSEIINNENIYNENIQEDVPPIMLHEIKSINDQRTYEFC